ncbi:MAG: hypothetical protein F6K19_36150, partial [Cyanothece sp. SIO1E1]|nr:hypothetical protein [Cyanothece sp. SIO1E1]
MNFETTGIEASKKTPCPLCGHEHYCYLVQNGKDEIIQVVCQWTDEPPDGWNRTNTAKDGRGVFTKHGLNRKRRHYPDYIQLEPTPKDNFPEWQDHLFYKNGDAFPLDRVGTAQELGIEYLYPTADGQPLGKVVRRQWSDRRRCYQNNRKTKQIRPWHWVGSPEEGYWSDKGKGDAIWPLYREVEAKDEILRGGIVFAVAGEQAVETYRQLGLTATTCQGGESNYKQILARLQDAFSLAKDQGLKPVLVIHPDNDITGENKFGDLLVKECDFARVPAVAIEPLRLWQSLPPGGDIKDLVDDSGLSSEQIIQALEVAIDEAIERQEEEVKARKQRARWNAPEVLNGELGYWKETDNGRTFCPRTDFDFQVERELASNDGGGLLLQIKRANDRSQCRIFIKSTDYTSAQKFEDSLKKAIGGGVICNLNTHQVKALVRARLHEYHVTRKGKVYRLVDRIGQQADGAWIFKQCQFDQYGDPTDESRSLWVWNNQLTGEESTLPSPKIAPQSDQALVNLVQVMARAFGRNIYPALFTLGYTAAGVHYQTIIQQEGAF